MTTKVIVPANMNVTIKTTEHGSLALEQKALIQFLNTNGDKVTMISHDNFDKDINNCYSTGGSTFNVPNGIQFNIAHYFKRTSEGDWNEYCQNWSTGSGSHQVDVTGGNGSLTLTVRGGIVTDLWINTLPNSFAGSRASMWTNFLCRPGLLYPTSSSK